MNGAAVDLDFPAHSIKIIEVGPLWIDEAKRLPAPTHSC